MMLLPSCGAIETAMLGCLGLLFPKAVARVLGIEPDTPLGISEFRAHPGRESLTTGFILAQSLHESVVFGDCLA